MGALGLAALLHVRLARALDAVARAAHELRGPLTAARLGLELGIRSPVLPPGRLRAIELELSRAELALDDLGAIHCPNRVLRREPVDLAGLAVDSAEAWRATADAHGVTLRLDRPTEPIWVTGERTRLAQAIGNLIANAIEHGGGGVEVRLGAQRGLVRLEVLDAGPGLPAAIADLTPRRRPWRLQATARGHGLAIASSIAAAHGGRLATAPSERGARVVLALPASEPGAVGEIEGL